MEFDKKLKSQWPFKGFCLFRQQAFSAIGFSHRRKAKANTNEFFSKIESQNQCYLVKTYSFYFDLGVWFINSFRIG